MFRSFGEKRIKGEMKKRVFSVGLEKTIRERERERERERIVEFCKKYQTSISRTLYEIKPTDKFHGFISFQCFILQ